MDTLKYLLEFSDKIFLHDFSMAAVINNHKAGSLKQDNFFYSLLGSVRQWAYEDKRDYQLANIEFSANF